MLRAGDPGPPRASARAQAAHPDTAWAAASGPRPPPSRPPLDGTANMRRPTSPPRRPATAGRTPAGPGSRCRPTSGRRDSGSTGHRIRRRPPSSPGHARRRTGPAGRTAGRTSARPARGLAGRLVPAGVLLADPIIASPEGLPVPLQSLSRPLLHPGGVLRDRLIGPGRRGGDREHQSDDDRLSHGRWLQRGNGGSGPTHRTMMISAHPTASPCIGQEGRTRAHRWRSTKAVDRGRGPVAGTPMGTPADSARPIRVGQAFQPDSAGPIRSASSRKARPTRSRSPAHAGRNLAQNGAEGQPPLRCVIRPRRPLIARSDRGREDVATGSRSGMVRRVGATAAGSAGIPGPPTEETRKEPTPEPAQTRSRPLTARSAG